METPKEYSDNLKDKVITKEMLSLCIYSSNERAKNFRDKLRKYKRFLEDQHYVWDMYYNTNTYNNRMHIYYEQKAIMLSILKPVLIKRRFCNYQRVRIYDYDKEYPDAVKNNKFVWHGEYYDDAFHRYVKFGDIHDTTKPIYKYYLFFDLGNDLTFHLPISEKETEKYSDLDIIDVDTIPKSNQKYSDLISVNFAKKVVELIKNGDFSYKE